MKPLFNHILLKLSGEALMGKKEFGIDLETIDSITKQIYDIYKLGIKISIVVGGGNIFRGISAQASGMDRTSADYTGMMATVINALLLQNSLEKLGLQTRVLSAIKMDTICEPYIRRRAIRHVEKNRIVIFAAGTGKRVRWRGRQTLSTRYWSGPFPSCLQLDRQLFRRL